MKITPAMLHDVKSKYFHTYIYFFTPDHSLEQIRYRLELLSHIGMMFNKGEGFTAESCGLNGQSISFMAGDADACGFPHNLPFSRVTQEKVTIHIKMMTCFGTEEIEKEVHRWIYRMEWTSEEIAEFVQAVYEDLGIVRR